MGTGWARGDIVGSSEGAAGLFRRESLGSGPREGGCSPEPGLENGRGRTCWGGCRAEGETGESKNSLGFLPQPPGRRRLGGETEECQKAFELKAKTAVSVLNLYNASLLGQKYNIQKEALGFSAAATASPELVFTLEPGQSYDWPSP